MEKATFCPADFENASASVGTSYQARLHITTWLSCLPALCNAKRTTRLQLLECETRFARRDNSNHMLGARTHHFAHANQSEIPKRESAFVWLDYGIPGIPES
jgi:hypothetical protein